MPGEPLANMALEAQTVKRARHFDIREHDAHRSGRLKNSHRFARIACLQNLEASLGQKASTRQTRKGLVLDDQDDVAGFCGFCLHRLNANRI
jgi:hypothetical protein